MNLSITCGLSTRLFSIVFFLIGLGFAQAQLNLPKTLEDPGTSPAYTINWNDYSGSYTFTFSQILPNNESITLIVGNRHTPSSKIHIHRRSSTGYSTNHYRFTYTDDNHLTPFTIATLDTIPISANLQFQFTLDPFVALQQERNHPNENQPITPYFGDQAKLSLYAADTQDPPDVVGTWGTPLTFSTAELSLLGDTDGHTLLLSQKGVSTVRSANITISANANTQAIADAIQDAAAQIEIYAKGVVQEDGSLSVYADEAIEITDNPPVIIPLGELDYFSQFDELIESGSSADRPDAHTGSARSTSTGVTGFSQPNGVACSGAVTYAQALELVEAAGARLPTLLELQDDATRGTGCNYDVNFLWTQTVGSNPGERMVDKGRYSSSAPKSIAETATAYVRYIYDNEPITNTLPSDVYHDYGKPYTDVGATAIDDADGDLTASIVTVNPVNPNKIGTYTVTYNVTDSAGNAANEVSRTVHVADLSPPVITPLGNVDYFSQFDELIESGSSVDRPDAHTGSARSTSTGVTGFSQPSDVACSGAVTYAQALELVEAAGARLPTLLELQDDATKGTGCGYDANLLWTQTVGSSPGERWVDTGNAGHANGGAQSIAETETAYVRYIYDNEPITNVRPSDVNLDVDEDYTDAGATATDSFDGDLTESIVTVNPVDTSTAGTYTITYNVSDAAGNNADEVTRTVIVYATTHVDHLKAQTLWIYPNPVDLFLHIAYQSATNVQYTVFDLSGKELATQSASGQTHRINVSDLSKGVYLLTAKLGNQNLTHRFVKE
ncbi:MAG: DUF5011 domain-containing protein [Flavobacteriaceae bacterium]|nr:DUF5011 domain-containing protein [Flavobacteriaceae bacterium]